MTIFITKPGTYTLTGDVHENIVISAPNVFFNGKGYRVVGDLTDTKSIGIFSTAAAKNATVYNVDVTVGRYTVLGPMPSVCTGR